MEENNVAIQESGQSGVDEQAKVDSTKQSATSGQTQQQEDVVKPQRFYFRKKYCYFCANKIDNLHYTDVDILKRFITEKGKIIPRRAKGTCARHQRMLKRAVKRARILALLPFVKE